MTSAPEFISSLVDGGHFETWDDVPGGPDAIVTGRGVIDGEPIALIISEFACVAGSMGELAGQRIVRAFVKARRCAIPVLAVIRSGGVRIQEGVPAFVQMIRTVEAVEEFAGRGGLFVAYLAGPAMGGVLASWVGQADVIMAAPGARIGLLGPRTAIGAPAETDRLRLYQMAEAWHESGRVDELVQPQHLRQRVRDVLMCLRSARDSDGRSLREAIAQAPSQSMLKSDLPILETAWEAVSGSRAATRIRAPELLKIAGELVVELRGDGAGGVDDPSSAAGLYRWRGQPVVVFAQINHGPTALPPTPAAYRKARRCIRLAQNLRLPLVNVVDTSGAAREPGSVVEDISIDISWCLRDLLTASVPTICVLLGEGTGGAAIAHFPADAIVAAEHSWLAPLSPEASSRLLWKTDKRAPTIASTQRVSARQLLSLGLVDRVVPQSGEDGSSHNTFGARMVDAVADELHRLVRQDDVIRNEARRLRYGIRGLAQCS